MSKPNRLTIRHITNMTDAVDDIVRTLGVWHLDEDFKKNIQKILHSDDQLEKLHQAVKRLDTTARSFYDIEIN